MFLKRPENLLEHSENLIRTSCELLIMQNVMSEHERLHFFLYEPHIFPYH